MILGTLSESARIESLHPAFKKAFDYIKSHDLLNAPLERITLDGEALFINNSAPTPRSQEEQVLEVHRRYLDIHVLLSGTERIGWKPLADLTNPEAPFNEADDYQTFAEPATTYFDMLPGQFLIVYPEDAHAPIIGTTPIRKLVVKVEI